MYVASLFTGEMVREFWEWSNAPRLQLARLSELYVMWYLVAPAGASQVAVSEPSARVRVMFETLPGGETGVGVGVGVGVGSGTKGPLALEFVHPP